MVKVKEEAVKRAAKVKLVLLDVHGVMTSNEVLYDDDGRRYRPFSHQDGFGVNALLVNGIEVAIITRMSKLVAARAKDIGIKRYYESKEKERKYQELLEELQLTDEQVCYVGDEIIDLAAMKRAGFAVAPSDACAEAKEVAHYVTDAAGGKGVVRELAELILRAQGKWEAFVELVQRKGWG
ncbi:MAG: HAD hydrolase family protein [Clostridia bacterium]|jgi:3-deoxy-D-manno-octulosonate 8-phosphate phosphatase (KDO 8-P phosphatase)|nr:HAD hydrolase family protein [Clostridia bacterium]MDH7572096.1 HAD hydrolase family protein [Clostridia bacterium]